MTRSSGGEGPFWHRYGIAGLVTPPLPQVDQPKEDVYYPHPGKEMKDAGDDIFCLGPPKKKMIFGKILMKPAIIKNAIFDKF